LQHFPLNNQARKFQGEDTNVCDAVEWIENRLAGYGRV
jgi:hypothetical protein